MKTIASPDGRSTPRKPYVRPAVRSQRILLPVFAGPSAPTTAFGPFRQPRK